MVRDATDSLREHVLLNSGAMAYSVDYPCEVTYPWGAHPLACSQRNDEGTGNRMDTVKEVSDRHADSE